MFNLNITDMLNTSPHCVYACGYMGACVCVCVGGGQIGLVVFKLNHFIVGDHQKRGGGGRVTGLLPCPGSLLFTKRKRPVLGIYQLHTDSAIWSPRGGQCILGFGR